MTLCESGIMRLWTLHPRYLDSKGLVAAWREALLAQKVICGGTKGYRNHPQLLRFRATADPIEAIAVFLRALALEAQVRGYNFDLDKILAQGISGKIYETRGQLQYEWTHLQGKLQQRDPAAARKFRTIDIPDAHPLFRIVSGGVRDWEKRAQNR
jgi:pyrimidine dimer DNA glycosylase